MLRVAIVGAGGMGSLHARCYTRIEGAELVGVMDVRRDVSERLAAEHGVKAYDDFERMLGELRPEILDICCPTPWHADYVCRGASRAKELGLRGISTEKPMGRTQEDCERMIRDCEVAGIRLFVAHVVRFFPEFAQAKQQIDAGVIGIPAAIRTRRGGAMPHASNDWYGDFAQSGGCVLDLIIHDFDWLRWTFGEVERVFAKGLPHSHLPQRDYALVTLRFKSGAVAHVEGTWADPGGFKVTVEVAGDQGLLEFNFNQPASTPFRSALLQKEKAASGVAIPESPIALDPYQAELTHFLHCVENGVTPDITPQDGAAAVRIALAAIRSIETGQPITL